MHLCIRASRTRDRPRIEAKETFSMSQPQSGIVPEPGQHALFLVLGVKHPERNAPWVALASSRLPSMTRKLGAADPRANLVSVVSFGPEFWGFISPSRRPEAFRHFLAMEAGGRRAPQTGGDLLIHIISRRHDLCFELAMQIMRELRPYVDVMDEVHGFRHLDSRDLTGFIDGTENPKGPRKRAAVALIGREDPDFAGNHARIVSSYRLSSQGRESGLRKLSTAFICSRGVII
jgi:putative iron-dependent peroxidase